MVFPHRRRTLPPDYPNSAPVLAVPGDVFHNWLNDKGVFSVVLNISCVLRGGEGVVVGHPRLVRWNSTLSLVKLVTEVLDHFRAVPIVPRGSAYGYTQQYPAPAVAAVSAGRSPAASAVQTPATLPPPGAAAHPSLQFATPSSFPELAALSRADLEALSGTCACVCCGCHGADPAAQTRRASVRFSTSYRRLRPCWRRAWPCCSRTSTRPRAT